ESDGELVLDSNLNLALFLRTESGSSSSEDTAPPETVTTETQLNVSAVAGTGLLGQIASTKVTRGGPFSISIDELEGTTQTSTSVTVEAGPCFGDDRDDTNGAIDIVPCDPAQ
ncbi:MAG: hypothetical protein KTR33_13625, partial [Gammaproteobacteria bacterium]|nr:hypothetical protein [Gammaproteobacteria bacterium]